MSSTIDHRDVPNVGEPGCDRMLKELQEVFSKHEKGGKVRIEYDTLLFHGEISGEGQ